MITRKLLLFLLLLSVPLLAQVTYSVIIPASPPGGVGGACSSTAIAYLQPLTGGNRIVTCDPSSHLWVVGGGGGSSLTPCGTTIGITQLYASSSALGCDNGTITLAASGSDDTAAIAAAIATGKNVHLSAGNWTVGTSCAADVFTISAPIHILGDGPLVTKLTNKCAAQNLFLFNYQIAGGFSNMTVAAEIGQFSVTQDSGVTATAGATVKAASASGVGNYVTGLYVHDLVINNTFRGIDVGTGVYSNVFDRIYVNQEATGGACVYYNSPAPSGDNNFNDTFCLNQTGTATGVTVLNADTFTFTNLKVNGSTVTLGGATSTLHVRFVNPSIEGMGGAPACGLNISDTTVKGTTIIGGAIGLVSVYICNPSNDSNLAVVGLREYPSGSELPVITLGRGTCQWLIGEAVAGNIGSNCGIEVTAARSIMNVASTTNGNNSGYRLEANSANGTTRQGGLYFTPGNSTATTYWCIWPDDGTCRFAVFSTGGVAANSTTDPGVGNFSVSGAVIPGTYQTATNCADSAGAAACGSAAAGRFVADAAATTVVVSTTAVTANSEIFIEYDSSLGTALSVTCNATIPSAYAVTARTAGTSFTLTTSANVANPGCFSYHIVN